MAILTACETARTKVSTRYGIRGLLEAFLRAGVTTVVSSLWKVPDVAAYMLISKFYELVFENTCCLNIAEALAAAQRWLKNLDTEEIKAYPPQSQNPNWSKRIEEEKELGNCSFFLTGKKMAEL